MQNVLWDTASLKGSITDIKHDIELLPKSHEVNQIARRVESLERAVAEDLPKLIREMEAHIARLQDRVNDLVNPDIMPRNYREG